MAHAMTVDDVDEGFGTPCDRSAMTQAARLILPSIAGVSSRQQLLSVPVSWTVFENTLCQGRSSSPRLQSRRRRGIAPAYPVTSHFNDMREGTLVAFSGGFVLEPSDRCQPCVNIPRASILSATFYRDAFDVTLSSRERIVVRTSAVEHIDSIFRGYFWNAMS